MKIQNYFDSGFKDSEQLPKLFTITFQEFGLGGNSGVKVTFNDSNQLGDVINDNTYENDFYRYHDIFHYSFATLLGWSPCARMMMMRKRKSDKNIDEIEDGARAAITEEALSMIIFNEAKRKNYFEGANRVSRTTLRIIKEMTENFEVNIRTLKEWEITILQSYEIFRKLMTNKGGHVKFDAINKKIVYTNIL